MSARGRKSRCAWFDDPDQTRPRQCMERCYSTLAGLVRDHSREQLLELIHNECKPRLATRGQPAFCPAEGTFPPSWRKRCRSRAVALHHSGHEPASPRDRADGCPGCACARAARQGQLACLDQEGANTITLMPLPPRSPELNPIENVWQLPRENWLPSRVFTPRGVFSITPVRPGPRRIMSLGLRDWAHDC
jgi:hypothetical protein